MIKEISEILNYRGMSIPVATLNMGILRKLSISKGVDSHE